MLVGVWKLWLAPESLLFRLAMSILLFASAAFVLRVLYRTNYTLTDHDLLVRSGPFHWTVRLDSITEIFPTHNPLSSPACSLDRLCIYYRGRKAKIMISPYNKDVFLQNLVRRVPGLTLEGQRVSRDQVR